MNYYYTCISSGVVGDIHLLYTSQGVVACGFGDKESFLQRNALLIGMNMDAFVAVCMHVEAKKCPYSNIIEEYITGSAVSIHNIPTVQQGTLLQQTVWNTLKTIPYGTTISYKDLALRCGAPRAIRAVASACAKNTCMIIVPCHRIVSSAGAVGKYAYGVEMKKTLLLLEKTK